MSMARNGKALEELEKPKARERQGERTDLQPSAPGSQKCDHNRVRETFGSDRTAERYLHLARLAPPHMAELGPSPAGKSLAVAPSIAVTWHGDRRAKERQEAGLRRGNAPAPAESRDRQKAGTGSDREQRREAVNEAGKRFGVSR